MKKTIQFFIILTLFLSITKSDLIAREVSGSLSAGEGSSFIPSQGSAFSIISDVTSGIYGGNFNILIKSSGRIIYQENNQLDDLYLVFNEPVDSGDVIKLDVVKGVFIFKMSNMDSLPDVIVDAIKKQAPREYKQLKPLHKPRKKKRPMLERVIQQETILQPVKKRVIQQEVIPQPVSDRVIQQEVISKPVEESRVIRRHIQPEDYKKDVERIIPPTPTLLKPEIVAVQPQPVVNKPIPTDISKPIAHENIIKPTERKRGIENISSSIDSVNKEIATVINSQSRAINSRVTKSGIEDVAKMSKVQTPKTSASGISSLPMAKTFPTDIDRRQSPVGVKSGIPQSQTKIESFSKTTMPTINNSQVGRFKTQIATTAVQKPKFQTPSPDLIVKRLNIQEKISKPRLKVAKTIPVTKIEPEVIRYVEPEIIAPPIAEIIEPEIIEKPIVRKEPVKDRIVITKTLATPKKKKQIIKDEPRVIKRHVQPKDYNTDQEQIPQRMSERVVGNGYGMATPGRIKVKAYSNSRPVSAWVEVFKADTSQRVKTFYTGSGKSLKDAKLPAGVYVIKATYRTAGSKRKKTIGKVTLEEGESINRSISFDDGSVNVKVTKSGNPIYAKVEVFKRGSKRRIAYEFSSKSNGVAKLSLGSGEYDIVVRDHANVRRFDSITVRGGKSKTLNADF